MEHKDHPLKDHVRRFSQGPGVYVMKGTDDRVLYVGKATNLRSRVLSYFSKEADSRYQVRFLMGKMKTVEAIVTDTEKEALLLENTLIKKYRPRYNVALKDDKSYVSLKLSIQHEAPRLYFTRRLKKDGSLLFGPYTSAGTCRDVVDFIQRHFRLRTCNDHDYRNRVRPCLQYQIKRCDAPCVGYISLEQYRGIVDQVRLFLEGKSQSLKKIVKQEMAEASEAERYEDAARYRDLLSDIERTLEKQKVVRHQTALSQDVLGFYREGEEIMLSVLSSREGALQSSVPYFLKGIEEDEEVITSFLTQYYEEGKVFPNEILLPLALKDQEILEEILRERAGLAVKLLVPQKGEKAALQRLAEQNARQAFQLRHEREQGQEEILRRLQEQLGLRNLPTRIECYDISNFQGGESVGSMVTFIQGRPAKKFYRHFNIKTVEGSNDFASMYEILCRRLKHSKDGKKNEEETPWALPNLLVIDGGKGQLSAAAQAIKDTGTEGVDLIALAKSGLLATDDPELPWEQRERKEERVFLPGRKNPVVLRQNSSELFLLTQARDEAHRFGIEFHRKWRKRRTLQSGLDAIEGVGKIRRQRLFQVFGSLKGIKEAEVSELAKVLGGPPDLAKRVKESL